MNPRSPELHTSGFRAILEIANERLGPDRVEALVRARGVTTDELNDPNGWFAMELASDLIGAISDELGSREWIVHAMRRAFSAEHLGILYPLMRSFGTPGFLYTQIPRFADKVNKVTEWGLEHLGPNKIRISARPKPGAPPDAHYLCVAREAQFAQLATLFDLPPANVEHPECMHRGDPACLYDIAWKEHSRPVASYFGLLAGVLLGAATISSVGPPWGALGAVVAVLGGWAGGRAIDLRRELRGRLRDLQDIHDALDVSTHAHEERYGELLDAKAEVDRKVEDATRKLSETLEELKALDRAKTDFFNNVSHELRSPLTLILAPLEDLVAGRTPAGGHAAALATMRRNAARLLHLINQLLDLAKLDAGEVKLAPVPTNLRLLIEGVVKGYESAAQTKRVRIVVEAPDAMRDVALDPRWMESAIGNLIGNAIKFTPEGGEVRITLQDGDDGVKLGVRDDGPGIAAADHEKVFQRFAQTDVSAQVVGGTGIGLALVRDAVRLHGGEVTLKSAPGEGSLFTLTLPRTLAAGPAARDTQPASTADRSSWLEQAEPDAGLEHPGPTPEAPLALVVEDNPDLRHFMVHTLGANYRVRAARDGAEGLTLATELEPEVIITDVAMPVMDGFELCRRVRASERTRPIPVLVVTARTEVQSVLEGFEAGASDYILKPFHGRELLARVDVHVRLRRLAQELALRERHAMLGVIAASVAHQVRNPLTTLVSGLPALRNRHGNTLDPASAEMMDIMIDCARRIEELTTDLMDISRVDRAEGADFRPSEGLLSAVRLVRARLPADVVLDEDVAEAAVIHGRPGDMNQVFLNLLDNAARAVGDRGRLGVSGKAENGHYVVRVGDSGDGIDPDVAARVFEPFFTTRPAGQGTGLGLAIASQVVRGHGGRIDLGRSTLGGAEFTVRIPTTARPSRQPASID